MKFIAVNDPQSRKEFLRLPLKIYKDDPNWIRPWDHDIENVFDPNKNKYFRHGEADRWILQNDQGETIGRIAAFINKREAKSYPQPTGGVGFFECINDQAAANALFDHGKAWLQERGMEAMNGPINFGEKNQWWGLLVEGFTPPPYGFNYNPPYYQELFENYGFQLYYQGINYYRTISGDFKDTYKEMGDRILANPEYTFPRFSKKEIDKYAEAFMHIYNKAWVTHESFQAMRKPQAMNVIKQLFPIIDEDMVVFCFHNDEPVGFFINIPDINQIIKHLNGKFNLWAKLRFKYMQMTGTIRKIFGIVYGVTPPFQRKGIEAAMALHAQKVSQKINRYDEFEMGWLGDFNPAMHRIADMINCVPYKTYTTYRKIFDETVEFKRRPIIGGRKKRGKEQANNE